ncbi:MAG: outer membrane protein [Legionellales bacterium]
MKHKILLPFGVIASLSAFAGTMGPVNVPDYKVIIAGIGGYSSYTNPGNQSYFGDNYDVFSFATNSDKGTGYGGGFLGIEHALPWNSSFYQLGVEYLYYASHTLNGTQIVGVEPSTSSAFTDQFRLQTQQLAASLRLLSTVSTRFHPYFSVSLGGAWNNLSQYAITNFNINAINIPAVLGDHAQSSFSYSLGVGIDTDINQNLRLGLGYRFTDFGQASFGSGVVAINNYSATVPFSVSTNHVQANAFFAQLSYLI